MYDRKISSLNPDEHLHFSLYSFSLPRVLLLANTTNKVKNWTEKTFCLPGWAQIIYQTVVRGLVVGDMALGGP